MSAIVTASERVRRSRLWKCAVAAWVVGAAVWAYRPLPDQFWWLPRAVGSLPAPLDEVTPLVAGTATLIIGLMLTFGSSLARRLPIALSVLLGVVVARNLWWTYEVSRLIGPVKWRETMFSLIVSLAIAGCLFVAWFRVRRVTSFDTQLIMGATFVVWLFCLAANTVIGYGI